MTILIWCYKCGSKWHGKDVVDLYGTHARCPVSLTTGTGTVKCLGITDGVQE